jgi:RHS repeat-associated protein
VDPAEGVATSLTYDAQGRVQAVTEGTGPTARTMTVAYAASGYPQSITDAEGVVTTYTTDAFGRALTQAVAGSTTAMAYDGRGLLASLTPPGASASTFVTDGRDLPTSATLLDGTALAWGYGPARRLTSSGPAGLNATYTYDAAGNLDTIGVNGGTFDATVDNTGRLTPMTSPWGPTLTNTWAGDQLMGTSWAGTPNASITRTLDDRRLTTADTVAGDARSYVYDDDGMLIAAGNAAVGHDPTSGLTTSVNLGVTERTFTHDPFDAVATDTTEASGTPTIGFDRTYDKLGRLVEVTETVGGDTVTTTYEYDDLGRVTEVSEDGGVVRSYTWDPSGDRLSRVDDEGTATATYSTGGRLLTADGSTYTYDAAGRLSKIDGPSGDTTLTYDAIGNLRSVTMPDGTAITYQVDGLGRRVSRSVDGTLDRRYVWDGELRLAAELNAAGGVIARYVYGEHPTLPLYAIRGGQTLGIVGDHVGSPRQLIDTATGDIVGERRYDEFGRVLEDTMGDLLPDGFAAGLGDPDTGLVRFGRRDYDPEIGRFTALDPLLYGGGHVNLYLYAAGDPLNLVDRDGRAYSLGEFWDDYKHMWDEEMFNRNRQQYIDKCWPNSIDTSDAKEAREEAAEAAEEAAEEAKKAAQQPAQPLGAPGGSTSAEDYSTMAGSMEQQMQDLECVNAKGSLC